MNFYQDKNKWKHSFSHIEISKNEADKGINWSTYKNHYALIKKSNVFLGDHHQNFICRRCLNSYTSGNFLMLQKQKCRDDNRTTIEFSNESPLHWKKIFHKNPLFFRINADFEAGSEKDKSSVVKKTTKSYKQNPVLKNLEDLI